MTPGSAIETVRGYTGARSADKLEFLRQQWVFYTATVVLLCSAAVYLWWKAHLS